MPTIAGAVNSALTRVATEFKAIRTLIGGTGTSGVGGLTTTATNLVAAINEVLDVAEAAAGGGLSESEVNDLIETAISALLDGAPAGLDTLNELAAALGDDASYAATITSALAGKAAVNSQAFTGTPSLPTGTTAVTQSAGDNSTKLATTAFVRQEVGDPATDFVATFEAGLA